MSQVTSRPPFRKNAIQRANHNAPPMHLNRLNLRPQRPPDLLLVF